MLLPRLSLAEPGKGAGQGRPPNAGGPQNVGSPQFSFEDTGTGLPKAIPAGAEPLSVLHIIRSNQSASM